MATKKKTENAEPEILEVLTTKMIKCRRCGKEFDFTPQEQKYFKKKGFDDPKLCPDCRELRSTSEKFICVDCNAEFEVNALQKEYFESHGLKIPCRCKACREIKRKRAEEQEKKNKAKKKGDK